MNYNEMIKRALNGRSVNATAKAWGLPQQTLDRYTKGERLPDYATALLMATEAGIEPGEVLRMLAMEEAKRRSKPEKISTSFNDLLRAANAYWIRLPRVA